MANFDVVPFEIINEIVNSYNLELYDQLNFMATNKFFSENIMIYFLYGKKINDQILKQNKYLNLRKLSTKYSPDITTISHLTTLTCLNCKVEQYFYTKSGDPISNHNNLMGFHYNNCKIKDITNLRALTWLKCGGYTCASLSVDNLDNLTYLDISNSCKLMNIKHLTNLTYLNAIDNLFISNAINCLTLLSTLKISNNYGITNIKHLTNLTCLDISNNNSIETFTHLINLTKLNIFSNSMANVDISKYFEISKNETIMNITHLTNLTKITINNMNFPIK